MSQLDTAALEKLVTELTTSGLDSLDKPTLEQLKRACKSDPGGTTIAVVFDMLFKSLCKPHAQIRLSSLQVIDVLFRRSHQFRLLLVSKLPDFIALATGAYKKPLPLPLSHAKELRLLALECIYSWVEKFGCAYQRLVYAYRYLRYVERADFKPAVKAIRKRDPERIRKQQMLYDDNRREYMTRSLVSVEADINRRASTISETLREMDECFAMLIPDIAGLFDDFDSGRDTRLDNSTGNRDEEDIDDEELLAVMAVNRHNINIEFNPDDPFEAEESDANRVVFDALRERLRLCVRFHQPRVQLWRDKLMRVNLTDTQNSEKHDILLGIANRLYQRIDDVILKCRDLKIDPSFTRRDEQRAVCGEGVDDGEADEDDEFEEVTDTAAAEATERLRATMAGRSRGRTSADPKKKNAVFSLLGQPVLKSDPTYIDRSRFEVLNRNRPTPSPIHERTENDSSNPIEDRLRETAPVIPFGPDLLYWDVNSIDTNTTGLEIRHRFLGSAREAPVISGEAIDRLRMRAVDYDTLAAARGIVIPSKRPIKACRAPMANGKLCQRRDLVKCPFHGIVIPRDEQGRPAAGFVDEAGDREPLVSEEQETVLTEQEERARRIATAESLNQLHWQDIDELNANKEKEKKNEKKRKAPATKSALIDVRKKRTTAVGRIKDKLGKR